MLRMPLWGLRREQIEVDPMPKDVETDELAPLLAGGGIQLIEVLPEKEYAEEHLPGAINIPLKAMNKDSVEGLDRSRPTVVYCWDDI